MSLTELGVYGLGAILFIAWLIMCAVLTRSGNLTIVGEWGVDACDVKKPGLWFIFWPLRSIMQRVPIATRTINIANFTVNTLMEDAGSGQISFRRNEIVPLISKEVSIIYHIDFFKPEHGWLDRGKLDGFFKLRTANGFDYANVDEILKDKVQSQIRELSCRRGALTIMSMSKTLMDEVRQKINALCSEQQIPVALIGLSFNSPLEFANPEHAKAVAAKATAVFRLDAVKKEQDVLEFIADRQIIIKRKEGEALGGYEQVILNKLFESFGITELPTAAQRYIAKLGVKAITAFDTLAKSPNKTFIVSSNFMDELRSILSQFGNK